MCLSVLDNVDPSTNPTKSPLPFSMSGDGVDDVRIPSVFMRKGDAQFLLDLFREAGEVVVRLGPAPEEEEENKGKSEEHESKEKELNAILNTLSGDFPGKDVAAVSKQLQDLLDKLSPRLALSEKKTILARELQKLRLLNSELNSADSANVMEEGKEKEEAGNSEEAEAREGGETGFSSSGCRNGDARACPSQTVSDGG